MTLTEFLQGIKSADNSAYTLKDITTKLVKLLETMLGNDILYNPTTQTLEIGTKVEIDGELTFDGGKYSQSRLYNHCITSNLFNGKLYFKSLRSNAYTKDTLYQDFSTNKVFDVWYESYEHSFQKSIFNYVDSNAIASKFMTNTDNPQYFTVVIWDSTFQVATDTITSFN